jgi:alcohol dehydrogenase class IV
MQLSDFTLFMPTKVISGIGISKNTGKLLEPLDTKRVLVVTDKGIRATSILDGILQSIENSGIFYDIFDEVEPNPSSETIHKGVDVFKEFRCDTVLAVGGGSSIDTAKGIAAMAANKGNILDYVGVGDVPDKPFPIVAIPTTAGTGSEVTSSTIVTDKKTRFKGGVVSPSLFPKLAILDPALTVGCPREITAATGMDALTHAIESYTSKAATPVSKVLALHAIKLIGENLLKAYYVGTDLESRSSMLTASMLAGFAFSQSRLGNVHAISHTFGGVFNITHGIANATLLPYVMKFNLPACPNDMKDIAEALGEDISGLGATEAAHKAVQAVEGMNKALNIPDNIKDLGVSLDYLDQMVKDSMKSRGVVVNPRLTSENDIRTIITEAYHGNK